MTYYLILLLLFRGFKNTTSLYNFLSPRTPIKHADTTQRDQYRCIKVLSKQGWRQAPDPTKPGSCSFRTGLSRVSEEQSKHRLQCKEAVLSFFLSFEGKTCSQGEEKKKYQYQVLTFFFFDKLALAGIK